MLNIVELLKMYETLTEFERALARFGDKVGLIAGLEIADKISPEEAYNKSRSFTEDLRASANKKSQIGRPLTRVCSKCGEEKPLDAEHFQVVSYFKHNYSYYCNECNKPKPRD